MTKKQHQTKEYLALSQHEGKCITCFNSNDEAFANLLINNWSNIIEFESPDLLLITGEDTIVFIEHFEFDSSENKSKGSSFMKELDCIDREMISKPTGIIHKQLKSSFSHENTTANLVKIFNNHYKKINTYKSNILESLIESGKITTDYSVKFISCFLIQDTSPLPFYDISSSPVTEISILNLRVLYELLEPSSELDYLLVSDDTNLTLIGNSKENINELKKVTIESDNIYFPSPHLITSLIEVPKEHIHLNKKLTDETGDVEIEDIEIK